MKITGFFASLKNGTTKECQTHGFSIIEVIIVISIGIVFVLSLVSLFRSNLLIRTANQNLTVASSLAENIVERMRSIPFNSNNYPHILELKDVLQNNGNSLQTFFSYFNSDVPESSTMLPNAKNLSSITLHDITENGEFEFLEAIISIEWIEPLRSTQSDADTQNQEYLLVTYIASGGLNDFITGN